LNGSNCLRRSSKAFSGVFRVLLKWCVLLAGLLSLSSCRPWDVLTGASDLVLRYDAPQDRLPLGAGIRFQLVQAGIAADVQESAEATLVRVSPAERERVRALFDEDNASSNVSRTPSSEARAAPSTPRALMTLILPLLISLGWIVFARRLDRCHPEPWALVLATFTLGASSAAAAAVLEWRMNGLETPMNATLSAFLVGIIEETMKFTTVFFFVRSRKLLDEPIDGIMYACTAALGFAAIENVHYFALGRIAPAIVVARALVSAPAHFLVASIWGFSLGRSVVRKRPRWHLVLGLALAAFCHGVFDASLGTGTLRAETLAVLLVLGAFFLSLCRAALRFGLVGGAETVPLSSARRLFRVGQARKFWLSFATMFMFAIALIRTAAHFGTKASVPLSAALFGLALLSALVWTAHLVLEWLPLDAAVDAMGVTYAGGLLRWIEIGAVLRKDAHVSIAHGTEILELSMRSRELAQALEEEISASRPR
jgi:protease PrsW